MLRSLRLGLLAACACALSSLHAQTEYLALLSGHQEVPSASTTAEGFTALLLDGDSLRVAGEIDQLSSPVDFSIAGGAHLHIGYAGQNGPVNLPIEITYDDDTQSAAFVERAYFVADNAALTDAMAEGRVYVNVHTLLWPGGEVRGQVFADRPGPNAAVYDAMLYGDQQNPPVTTDGMGGVLIEVTDNEIAVSGSFRLESPLDPIGMTGAHLHLGLHGVNGGIAQALTPTMDADGLSGVFERSVNTFPFNAALADGMRARRIYVNVHSVEHPSGEVRGQVVGAANNVYFSYVSDVDPQPNPSTTQVMRQMAEKVMFEDSIQVSGSISGYTQGELAGITPFAQFNNVTAGQPGLTIFPLNSDVAADGNSAEITVTKRAASADAQAGLYRRYFTRGGLATPAGQVLLDQDYYHECKRAFYTSFTASQTVPNSTSTGLGEMITEYYTSRIEMNGVVRGLSGDIDQSVAGGFHVHEGLAGRSGAIVVGVPFIDFSNGGAILPESAIAELTAEQAAAMRERQFYYNVHTANFPSGELRGQILPRSNALYHAPIAAGQAVPGYGPSPAMGAIIAELTGDQMVVSGSFNDLVGGFAPDIAGGAHLHGGIAGRSGAILAPLTSFADAGASEGDFFASDNTFTVSTGLLDSMAAYEVYANIHSQDRPAGELRGQVGPLATAVVHGKLSPDVTVPYTGMLGASEGQGHIHVAAFDTTLVLSGSWDSLSTMVDVTVAGGAHMHDGTVGQTGGILFGIAFDMEAGGTSAFVDPDSNRVEVPFGALNQLLAGDIYANVHTTGAPSGAIRGQMLSSVNMYPEASSGFDFPPDGATLDLASGDLADVATIDWANADDPDDEQDVGYLWQLYADTTAAPVVQTVVSDSSGVSFTFGALDTLLASLGVADGASVTVFHRAVTTDGSLLTPGGLAEVTLVRRMEVSAAQLPAGSVRLVNTAVAGASTLLLDVGELPAGPLEYRITSTTGQTLTQQRLDHSGFAQRYELAAPSAQSGMYVLEVSDRTGRSSSWMFVVK